MSSVQDHVAAALAAEIKAARQRANLSQPEAASMIGVALRTYQEWEAARVIPQPRHRRRIQEFCAEAAA